MVHIDKFHGRWAVLAVMFFSLVATTFQRAAFVSQEIADRVPYTLNPRPLTPSKPYKL